MTTMLKPPKILLLLMLMPASCLTEARDDDYTLALARERQAAAITQARNAQLEAEIASIRAKVMEFEQNNFEMRKKEVQLAQQLERLLELQKRTYQAVAENSTATIEYSELPAQTQRQTEFRALVRNIDHLSLTPEQKQAIIQLLRPPRPLDDTNPWGNTPDWH